MITPAACLDLCLDLKLAHVVVCECKITVCLDLSPICLDLCLDLKTAHVVVCKGKNTVCLDCLDLEPINHTRVRARGF